MISIFDQTGKLGPALVAVFAQSEEHWKGTVGDPATTDDHELERLRHKDINGFVRITADGLDKGEITYRGDNATNQTVIYTLHALITAVVQAERGAEHGLSPTQVSEVLAPPTIRAFHTTGATAGESGGGTFILGYIIAFILYMVITLYGVNVLRSIVTEKSSRVVELMAAASKPRSMMSGKIIGVGGAGLAQVAVWFIFGGIALAYRVEILRALGAGADAASVLPSLSLVPWWSPMLMPLRYILGGATPGEVALSLGILLVTTVLIARAAAKIYRVGILMYGKRPGFGELLRWLRY